MIINKLPNGIWYEYINALNAPFKDIRSSTFKWGIFLIIPKISNKIIFIKFFYLFDGFEFFFLKNRSTNDIY